LTGTQTGQKGTIGVKSGKHHGDRCPKCIFKTFQDAVGGQFDTVGL